MTAENGPIGVGDLLVASWRAGYAMKYGPQPDAGRAVGKALEPLRDGQGHHPRGGGLGSIWVFKNSNAQIGPNEGAPAAHQERVVMSRLVRGSFSVPVPHRQEEAMRRLIMAALFLAVAPGLGYARAGEENWENLKQLQVGQKIEVVDMALKSLTGTFVSFSDEAISLRIRKNDFTVRRPDVLRVSLHGNKRPRNTLIGAAIGVGAGAAIAGLLGKNECPGSQNCTTVEGASIAVGGGIGAGLGALSAGDQTIYRAKGRRGSKNPLSAKSC